MISLYNEGAWFPMPPVIKIRSRLLPAETPLLRYSYSGILAEFLLAFSIANLTMLPQSLEETEPQPSLLTISYTPSSRAISCFRLSDITPFRLLINESLLTSNPGSYMLMFSMPIFFILPQRNQCYPQISTGLWKMREF